MYIPIEEQQKMFALLSYESEEQSEIELDEFPDNSEADAPENEDNPKPEASSVIITEEASLNLQIPEDRTNSCIPNTYADLFDTPCLWSNITLGEDDKAEVSSVPMDEEISSFEDLFHGEMEYFVNAEEILIEIQRNIIQNRKNVPLETKITTDTLQVTLASYIQKMPHGIVDKQIAGIGATTLEINSNRNSIIVVPTKILAYRKHIKHKVKTLYVGGRVNRNRIATEDKEIKDYLNSNEIEYKKFLVVADSLSRLLGFISKKHYDDYFLMIDEVDMIQSESNYRPKLESLIDFYFQFPPKNRCLVTATMREFSNPRLQQECKFKLTWNNPPKRNIQLYYTDNIDALAVQHILTIPPTEKIVIAYNSILHCKNIIKLLSQEIQEDCAILCSASSINEAHGYYAELTSDSKLPKRICFFTSCYFAGVDIEDSYHLLTISNAQQNYQMLSLDKMTQIYGRCRISNGIISDTIIANTRKDIQNNAVNDQSTLIKQAEAIVQLQQAALELSKQDADLADLFKVIKTAIREKAAVKFPREEPVKLTRENIYKENVPAYMNIDYLVGRQNLCDTIYKSYKNLYFALKDQGHDIKFEYRLITPTLEQTELETSNIESTQSKIDKQLQKAIEEIREVINQKGELSKNDLEKYLSQRNCKEYVQRLYKLRTFADIETLMDKLWEIRHNDKRAYKNLQNAVFFWALDDKHPFKRDLYRVFKIDRKYKTGEIYEQIAPIVKYHLHKSIKQRAAVSLLKSLFLVERPKIYLIKDKNPLGFKKHGSRRIPKTEGNLLKYFQI